MTFSLADLVRDLFCYDPVSGVLTYRTSRGGRKAGARAGSLKADGYRNVRFNHTTHREHRVIFLWMEGRWPVEVDHDNRVRDDNRWDNLLESTRAKNNANTGGWSKKPSGLPLGVHHSRSGTYIAVVTRNGKQKYLGSYKSVAWAVEVASEARK